MIVLLITNIVCRHHRSSLSCRRWSSFVDASSRRVHFCLSWDPNWVINWNRNHATCDIYIDRNVHLSWVRDYSHWRRSPTDTELFFLRSQSMHHHTKFSRYRWAWNRQIECNIYTCLIHNNEKRYTEMQSFLIPNTGGCDYVDRRRLAFHWPAMLPDCRGAIDCFNALRPHLHISNKTWISRLLLSIYINEGKIRHETITRWGQRFTTGGIIKQKIIGRNFTVSSFERTRGRWLHSKKHVLYYVVTYYHVQDIFIGSLW